MDMKTKIGEMLLQDKGHLRVPETNRSKTEAWNWVSLTASEGASPANTLVLDFQPAGWETIDCTVFRAPGRWYFVIEHDRVGINK